MVGIKPTTAQTDDDEKKASDEIAASYRRKMIDNARDKAMEVLTALNFGKSSASDTIFDPRHAAEHVCIAVSCDAHSYHQWLAFVDKLGEKAVRRTCLQLWNETEANKDMNFNRSAALMSRLKALMNTDAT